MEKKGKKGKIDGRFWELLGALKAVRDGVGTKENRITKILLTDYLKEYEELINMYEYDMESELIKTIEG